MGKTNQITGEDWLGWEKQSYNRWGLVGMGKTNQIRGADWLGWEKPII